MDKKLENKIYFDRVEDVDYIICKIYGQQCSRIYGKHLKSHNLTSAEYKKMFSNAILSTKLDKINISKNSGQFMKLEKYKKIFSELFKGEKNPNHKSKTTEQHRKECSPFSKEFYIKRNLTEDDKINFFNKVRKYADNTKIEYYLNKGINHKDALLMLKSTLLNLKKRKRFCKTYCVEKYGEVEGLKKWQERQEKWKNKVFNNNTHISKGTSNLSNNIINSIIDKNNTDIILYDKTEKFIYNKELNKVYKYDLTNLTNKKIIEINGVFQAL